MITGITTMQEGGEIISGITMTRMRKKKINNTRRRKKIRKKNKGHHYNTKRK